MKVLFHVTTHLTTTHHDQPIPCMILDLSRNLRLLFQVENKSISREKEVDSSHLKENTKKEIIFQSPHLRLQLLNHNSLLFLRQCKVFVVLISVQLDYFPQESRCQLICRLDWNDELKKELLSRFKFQSLSVKWSEC